MRVALTGYFVKANKDWYTKAEAISIQSVFVLKYYTRWSWSLKNEKKLVINHQLIVIIPTVSCAKVLLSESITISLQNMKNVLIGVPNKVSGVDLFDVVFWLMLSKEGH